MMLVTLGILQAQQQMDITMVLLVAIQEYPRSIVSRVVIQETLLTVLTLQASLLDGTG
jgi:hypothetical protein